MEVHVTNAKTIPTFFSFQFLDQSLCPLNRDELNERFYCQRICAYLRHNVKLYASLTNENWAAKMEVKEWTKPWNLSHQQTNEASLCFLSRYTETKFTYTSVKCVVISRERIEGSELRPPCTEFFIGVTVKSANICSDQRNTKQIKV